jgi:membrane fusion protein (multidrug efflux system)
LTNGAKLFFASLTCLMGFGPFTAPSFAADEVPIVIVAEARTIPFPLTTEALGTALANESVDIRAQVSQRIISIKFEEGKHAEQGQVLVELQSAEARADVASARAALAESQNQLERAKLLYETNTMAQSELDTRRMHRDAERAGLDAAESRLSDTRIRAPFAGMLGLRRVSLGSYVTPQDIITTLDDIDTIKLDFAVPETALAKIVIGLPIVAHNAAWPDIAFEGRVSSLDTRLDPVSRSLMVRALLPNPDGRLRPGMFLTVKLIRDDTLALVIPESAVVPDRSRQFLWILERQPSSEGEPHKVSPSPSAEMPKEGSEQLVRKTEIRTGRRKPGFVEVLQGLSPGDIVVVEGTQKTRPGTPVRINWANSPSSKPLPGIKSEVTP